MQNEEQAQRAIEQGNDEIEQAIHVLEKSNNERNIFSLIQLLQEAAAQGGRFFVPVLDSDEVDQPPADLFTIHKVSVNDFFSPPKPPQAMPRKVELYKGGNAYTAFTSRKELEKGEGTKYTSMFIQDFLELAYDDDSSVGIVLNPWDVSVLLDKKILTLILNNQIRPDVAGQVFVQQGDITKLKVDAVVNAANTSLTAGGGVCGAIFQAAGPELIRACRKIGACPVGEARITRAYNLPAKYIIHTPGPVYSGTKEDETVLANSYYNSLELARKHNLRSIAFPAISTGIYGYPMEKAVPVAVLTVSRWINEHPNYPINVYLICFDDDALNVYLQYIH